MATAKPRIAFAYGDGKGPEILRGVFSLLKEAGTNFDWIEVSLGEKCFLKGYDDGIDPKAWDILNRCDALIKAPIIAPSSRNLHRFHSTLQHKLNLCGSLGPCIAYSPFIETKHPTMNVVIAQEYEEYLINPLEYRQSADLSHDLRTMHYGHAEKMIRFAFEYTRHHKRKKLSCFTNSDHLKYTDGLFHDIFYQVATEYPDVETNHLSIDAASALLATHPEQFDVIVLPNDYGHILYSIARELTGCPYLTPRVSLGDRCALFQAGDDQITSPTENLEGNPSGLLLAAVMMLEYFGDETTATTIHNAFLRTIEEGVHTPDIFNDQTSKIKVNTEEFLQTVSGFLGQVPTHFEPTSFLKETKLTHLPTPQMAPIKKQLIGVDTFFCAKDPKEKVIAILESLHAKPLQLSLVTNNSHQVWPNAEVERISSDEWQCRFLNKEPIAYEKILSLLNKMNDNHIDVIRTENLYYIDDKPSFSPVF